MSEITVIKEYIIAYNDHDVRRCSSACPYMELRLDKDKDDKLLGIHAICNLMGEPTDLDMRQGDVDRVALETQQNALANDAQGEGVMGAAMKRMNGIRDLAFRSEKCVRMQMDVLGAGRGGNA